MSDALNVEDGVQDEDNVDDIKNDCDRVIENDGEVDNVKVPEIDDEVGVETVDNSVDEGAIVEHDVCVADGRQ